MTIRALDKFLRIFESYSELHAGASALCAILSAHDRGGGHAPVIIYGHKDRRYLIAYWACILAARPLIPVEPDTPVTWIQRIRDHAGASVMLDATSTASAPPCAGVKTLPVPATAPAAVGPLRQIPNVAAGEIMYIMFSSGTSGQPKGIRISYGNVIDFLTWLETFLPDFGPIESITGNVRFCFDVSLFELWTSWLLMKPLTALDHIDFFNSRKYIKRLREHGVTTWISTPTMVRCYLADPYFNGSELPALNTFLFCGEVLTKGVVTELWDRFKGSRVFNTYGPTECTVAVTSVRILPSHTTAQQELPIGYARPGTRLHLAPWSSEDGCGEIMISGRAVGPGYLNLPERQEYNFPTPDTYRTGDLGRVNAEGLWYFEGRMDRECKILGFRIDLNAVEAYIRQLPGVIDVVTDIYHLKGEPRALKAFVLGPEDASQLRFLARKMAREQPPYLIPRFWYAVLEPALNHNTKLNRPEIIAGNYEVGVRYVYSHGAGDSGSHRPDAE
jgi:D-alanine--poly(phosphoribitol) ligase subunit 1